MGPRRYPPIFKIPPPHFTGGSGVLRPQGTRTRPRSRVRARQKGSAGVGPRSLGFWSSGAEPAVPGAAGGAAGAAGAGSAEGGAPGTVAANAAAAAATELGLELSALLRGRRAERTPSGAAPQPPALPLIMPRARARAAQAAGAPCRRLAVATAGRCLRSSRTASRCGRRYRCCVAGGRSRGWSGVRGTREDTNPGPWAEEGGPRAPAANYVIGVA